MNNITVSSSHVIECMNLVEKNGLFGIVLTCIDYLVLTCIDYLVLTCIDYLVLTCIDYLVCRCLKGLSSFSVDFKDITASIAFYI